MNSEATKIEVAEYMTSQINENEVLYQDEIVHKIEEEFGDEFVYVNKNGNVSIDQNVLEKFRDLTPEVVWVRGERMWRFREEYEDSDKRVI